MQKTFASAQRWPTIATPTSPPPSGAVSLYFKSDGLLYRMDSAGVESTVGEPITSVATASQFRRGDKTWQPINGFNLIQNPGFEDLASGGSTGSLEPHWVDPALTAGPSSVSRSGQFAAHLRCNSPVTGGIDIFVANGVNTGTTLHPRCAVGETYRAEFWVRTGTTATTPTVRPLIKTRDATGAVIETAHGTAVTVSGTYTLMSVELTVSAATAVYVVAGINVPNGLAVDDTFRVDDMSLRYIPPVSTPVQAALNLKADVALIAAKNGTDAPTTYPVGNSVFVVDGTTGWPEATGIITTSYINANSARQTLTTKANITYVRAADAAGTNGWTPWGSTSSNPGWISYTPSLVSGTLGNATLTGAYRQVGTTVDFRIEFTFGSSTSFTGTSRFSLPFTAARSTSTTAPPPIGTSLMYRSSTSAYRFGVTGLYATGAVRPYDSTGVTTTATTPWTWAAGDLIQITGTYESI